MLLRRVLLCLVEIGRAAIFACSGLVVVEPSEQQIIEVAAGKFARRGRAARVNKRDRVDVVQPLLA